VDEGGETLNSGLLIRERLDDIVRKNFPGRGRREQVVSSELSKEGLIHARIGEDT